MQASYMQVPHGDRASQALHSPSMRARHSRVRQMSNAGGSSSTHSTSSGSLNSFSDRSQRNQRDHFRSAGRSIVNGPDSRGHRGAAQGNQTQNRAQQQSMFLQVNNQNGDNFSAKSMSSISQRSNSAQSHNSQDVGHIYSSRSSSRQSSTSSRKFQPSPRVHFSQVDSFQLEETPSSGGQAAGANQGVIRIEMLPKQLIKTRLEQRASPVAKDSPASPMSTRESRIQILVTKDYSSEVFDRALKAFRKGPALRALEQTHIFSEGLLLREPSSGEPLDGLSLLDLDDEGGADACKSYLCALERFMTSLGLVMSCRAYRDEFTNSYKVLYRQMLEQFGSQAGYLPEILDSAQEAFDHLWVNGEKYIFSENVIDAGRDLFQCFCQLRHLTSQLYVKHFKTASGGPASASTAQDDFAEDLGHVKELLLRFDELWTGYEQKYVYELMVIENDARRFIIDSINVEAVLSQAHMQAAPMRATFNEQRAKLLENICQVNAVANLEGKGRDDFQFSLMLAAEGISKKADYSHAVRSLATKVQQSFNAYRALMLKYQENIELVDP